MQKREVMQDTAADGAEADGDKARAGIQSVEVGFALLQVLAQGPGAWMLRDWPNWLAQRKCAGWAANACVKSVRN